VDYNTLLAGAIAHSIEHGIELPQHLNLDGTFKRFSCRPEAPSSKDEWYIGHELESGHIIVTYGTHRPPGTQKTFRSWRETELSKEELKELQRQQEDHFLMVKEMNQQIAKDAQEKSQKIWAESLSGCTHPYLERKSVTSHHSKVYKDWLVVPVYSAEDDKLSSLQFIAADGTKRFLKGGVMKRGYSMLLGSGQPFIAEGFATAATVHQATGRTVIIAFSAQNCLPVALHLKKRGKLSTVDLLQDHGEAGEKVGQQWKEQGLGVVYKPHWTSAEPRSDWNDLAQDEGESEVRRQLQPPRFPSMEIMDFLATEKPPVEWVVENLFTTGSYNVLFAAPGQGKSMLALHLLIAAQLGGQAIDGYPSIKQNVLYVDAELTAPQLDERIRGAYALWQHCGDMNADLGRVTMIPWLMLEEESDVKLNLFDPVSQAYMDPLIEEHDLVVLDNFDKVTRRGDGDDSRSDEFQWQTMWDWIRKWKARGKTFLVLAHVNKNGSLRGTGKIGDDADTQIQLKRVPSDILPPEYEGRLSVIFDIVKGRSIPEEAQKPRILSLHDEISLKSMSSHPFLEEFKPAPWQKLSDADIELAMKIQKEKTDLNKLTR